MILQYDFAVLSNEFCSAVPALVCLIHIVVNTVIMRLIHEYILFGARLKCPHD